jgi:hypothetical protein
MTMVLFRATAPWVHEFQSICRAVRSSGEAAHREQTADVGCRLPPAVRSPGKIAFSNGACESCSRMVMGRSIHRCSRPEIASFTLNYVVVLKSAASLDGSAGLDREKRAVHADQSVTVTGFQSVPLVF